ncbi:6227_t:CDS:2, partial [Entrophospora sp. SA101]
MTQSIKKFFPPINHEPLPISSDETSDDTIISDNNNETDELNKRRKLNKKNSGRHKKENLKFKHSWKVGRPWLKCEIVEDQKLMFCAMCQKANLKASLWSTTGCNYMKLEYVKRHEDSNEHKTSINFLDPAQTSIKESVHLLLGMDAKNIIHQMRNVYFLSQHNIALNVFPDMSDFVTYQMNNVDSITNEEPLEILRSPKFEFNKDSLETIKKNQNSNYATYNNKVAGRDFLKSIARIIEENVILEIKNSTFWSLLLDESNTNSTAEKTLALVSKHITDDMPVLRFLGLIKINNATSDSLLSVVESFLLQKGLEISKMYHFGSDGASNMRGVNNGLSSLLKRKNPFLTSNHCIAHRVHLAAEDAAKQIPYFNRYKEIIKTVYSFFSNSYKRMYELKSIQENSECPDLAILNVMEIRWLSWANVINNFHQILDDVHQALYKQKDNSSVASFLYEAIDTEFYIFTKFLADIFSTMKSMIMVFQSDYVTLSETRNQLTMVISTITSDFIGSETMSPTYGICLKNYMEDNIL